MGLRNVFGLLVVKLLNNTVAYTKLAAIGSHVWAWPSYLTYMYT